MQIFGRAGRPQFDTSGHGVIITSHDKLAHYLKLLHAQLPVESALQARMAGDLGFEAGLFLPSGTQSNLVALMAHCARGDEYIVGMQAHTYKYEGGGAAVLGSIQPQPLPQADDGSLPLDAVEAARTRRPDDHGLALAAAEVGDVERGQQHAERARPGRPTAAGHQLPTVARVGAHVLEILAPQPQRSAWMSRTASGLAQRSRATPGRPLRPFFRLPPVLATLPFCPLDGGSEELSGVFGGWPRRASSSAMRETSAWFCVSSASTRAKSCSTSAFSSALSSDSRSSGVIQNLNQNRLPRSIFQNPSHSAAVG
jgi:hypothetical protein